MTIKTGLHNYNRLNGRTADTRIINVTFGELITKKFKFSYECFNAGETFHGELFDGDKLNSIFTLTDLGEARNSNMYAQDEKYVKVRIDALVTKGIIFIKSLY
jgi:hypothetical protein